MADTRLQLVIEAQNRAEREINNLKDQVSDLDSSSSGASISFGKLAGSIAAGLGIYNLASRAFSAITTNLKEFISDSVNLALQTETTQIALYQLGENTGRTKEEIDRLIGAVREKGKSYPEALSVTKAMVQAHLGEADAINLLTKARDLGISAGMSSADASGIMLDAILTMRPESLKELGITVSATEAYGKFANQLGKSANELTDAEKKQAIFNIAMEKGEEYAGLYDKAMGTAGKQLLSLKDMFVDVKYVAGKVLTQGFEPLISSALDGAKSFSDWALDSEGNLNPQLQQLADTIGDNLVRAFEWLKTRGVDLWNTFRNNVWPVLVDIWNTIINDVIPAMINFYNTIRPFFPVLLTLSNMFRDYILFPVRLVIDIFGYLIDKWNETKQQASELKDRLVDTFNIIRDTLSDWYHSVSESISNFIDEAIEYFRELPNKIKDAIWSIGSKIWEAFEAAGSWLFDSIADFITRVIDGWLNVPDLIKNALFAVGSKIWEAFLAAKNWVLDKIRTEITDKIVALFDIGNIIWRKLQGIWNNLPDWAKTGLSWIGIGSETNRQFGGPVLAGQAYTVGEAGPETFVPATSGMILPNAGVTVNFNNPTVRSEEDMSSLVQVVKNTLNREMRLNQIGV